MAVRDLEADGWTTSDVVTVLARSLGLAAPGERVAIADLVERFDPDEVPKDAVTLDDLQRSEA